MANDGEVSIEYRNRIVVSIDKARQGDKDAARYCCHALLIHLRSGRPLPKSLYKVAHDHLTHIAEKCPLTLFPGARKPAGRPRSRLPKNQHDLDKALSRVRVLIAEGKSRSLNQRKDSAFQQVGKEMGPKDEEDNEKWVDALQKAYQCALRRPVRPLRRYDIEY